MSAALSQAVHQAIYGSLNGQNGQSVPTPELSIVDSIVPSYGPDRTKAEGELYTRDSKLVVPNFTGDETTYFELLEHENTPLPRKWRNEVSDPSGAWTEVDASYTYEGNGEFVVSGIVDSADYITKTFKAGVDIENHEKVAACYIKAEEESDIGKDIVFRIQTHTGTFATKIVTATLTDEWQPICTEPLVGASGNTGYTLVVIGAGSNIAAGCRFKDPTVVDVTNVTNKVVLPLPVDTPTGPELLTNGQFEFDGRPFAYFDGVIGTGYTAPAVNLSTAEDIDLRTCHSFSSLVPSTGEYVVGQWDTSPSAERGFTFGLHTTGYLRSAWSDDGADGTQYLESSAAISTLGIKADTVYFWRVVYTVSTGDGEMFYCVPRNDEEDAWDVPADSDRWISLGSDTTVNTTLHNCSANVVIGGLQDAASSNNFEGKVCSVEMRVDGSDSAIIEWNAANFIGEYLHDSDAEMLSADSQRVGVITDNANTPFDRAGEGSLTHVGDGTELYTTNAADNGGSGTGDWTAFNGGVLTEGEDEGQPYLECESNTAPQASAGCRLAVQNQLANGGTLEHGKYYAINLEARHLGTGGAWFFRIDQGTGGSASLKKTFDFPAIADTEWASYSGLFRFDELEDLYLLIRENNSNNDGGVQWRNLSIQELDYTIVSDEDDTAAEARWDLILDCPDDGELYKYTLNISQGTSTQSTFRLRFQTGGTAESAIVDLDWETLTLTSNAATVNAELTETEESGVYSLSIWNDNTDDGNTEVRITIYPTDSDDPDVQGTVNVHSVSLKGIHWTPLGNIQVNQTDWTSFVGDCVVGTYQDKLYVINTEANYGIVWQSVPAVSGKRYVYSANENTDSTANSLFRVGTTAAGAEIFNSAIDGPDQRVIDSTAASLSVAIGTNTPTLGLISIYDSVSFREATRGLGASNYKNANTVTDGVVTEGEGLPLHPYVNLQVPGNAAVQVPARYEHFPTSEALAIGERYISSLANKTHPNGSQGIFNKVAGFPNVLPPDARIIDNWIDTPAVMSQTPFGDGVELNDGVVDSIDAEWTDNGDGTFTCDGTSAKGVYFDLDDGTIETLNHHVVEVEVTEYTSGTLQVAIYDGDGLAKFSAGITSAGTHTFLLPLDTVSVVATERVLLWSSSSFIGTVGTPSVQKHEKTLIEDTEAAGTSYLYYNLDIPTDNETWEVKYRVERYDSDIITLGFGFTGTTNIWFTEHFDFDSGTVIAHGANSNGTGESTVEYEGDGVYLVTLRYTDSNANDNLQAYAYGVDSRSNANTGGVYHYPVEINRISAAAEPDWNPLKPGGTVKQYCRWRTGADVGSWNVLNGTMTRTGGGLDIFGGTDGMILEDTDATNTPRINQTQHDASDETSLCTFVFVEKQPTYTHSIRLNQNFGTVAGATVNFNPATGEIREDNSLNSGTWGAIDGAILKAMGVKIGGVVPSHLDRFWLIWVGSSDSAGDSTPQINIWPARSATWSNNSEVVATGETRICYPTTCSGLFPYFFDAFTDDGTNFAEEVQDFSKIFSYLKEGCSRTTTQDIGLVNAIFTHGYYERLGWANSTALTPLIGTPTYVDGTGDWTAINHATSVLTDKISVFPGKKAIEFEGDGTSTSQSSSDTIGTFPSGYQTMVALVEATDDSSLCMFGLYNTTDSNWGAFTQANFNTGVCSTTIGPSGQNHSGDMVPVGEGPNGGQLWLCWGKFEVVPAEVGDGRRFYIYYNGSAANSSKITVHYTDVFDSDIVSILPILDGNARAEEEWSYGPENFDQNQGVLVADFLTVVDGDDLGAGNQWIYHVLYASNGAIRSYDGTTAKQTANGGWDQTDNVRNVVRWSAEGNEHTLRTHFEGFDTEDSSSTPYDGTFTLTGDRVEVYQQHDNELFMPFFNLGSAAIDSSQSQALAAYN